jgi:hypothetical protein
MVEDKVPMEKIKPIVKDTKYICKGCMHTAVKAENVCPEKPQKSFLAHQKKQPFHNTPTIS